MRHIVLDHTGELIAEAHDVVVLFNFLKNAKQPIPDTYRERIESVES